MIILLYHNVLEHRPSAFNMLARPDWLTVSEFEAEIASLAERFQFVSVADIATAVREGRRIPRACAITFDDGYVGAYKYGLPILEKYGGVGTYYVITDQLSGDKSKAYDFFDRLEALLWLTNADAIDLTELGGEALPLTCDACKLKVLKRVSALYKALSESRHSRLNAVLTEQLAVSEERVQEYLAHEVFQPMTWDDVNDVQLHGGEVGSHSRSHRSLSQLDAEGLRGEVCGSMDELRSHVNGRDLGLAYPFGHEVHYNAEVIEAARDAGFTYALTAISGVNDEQTPLFELHRSAFVALKKLRKAR